VLHTRYYTRGDRDPKWVPAIVTKVCGSRHAKVRVLQSGHVWRRPICQLRPRPEVLAHEEQKATVKASDGALVQSTFAGYTRRVMRPFSVQNLKHTKTFVACLSSATVTGHVSFRLPA